MRSLASVNRAALGDLTRCSSSTGVVQLEMMDISSISVIPEFKNLFPLDDGMVKEISESMKKSGFDKPQALHIYRDRELDRYVLLDGHTRLAAAELAGITEVPVYKHSFSSRDEAKFYALSLQLFRRNITQDMYVKVAKEYISLGERTGGISFKNLRTLITERLGIGKSTAAKIIAVAKSEEAREQIENGASLDEAYQNIQKLKKAEKLQKEETQKEETCNCEQPNEEACNEPGETMINRSARPTEAESEEPLQDEAAAENLPERTDSERASSWDDWDDFQKGLAVMAGLTAAVLTDCCPTLKEILSEAIGYDKGCIPETLKNRASKGLLLCDYEIM